MKCCNPHSDIPCSPEMDCWINAPDYFNCYCIWQYFHPGVELTLHEVGDLLNLSYETIRKIEAKAIIKYTLKMGVEKFKVRP